MNEFILRTPYTMMLAGPTRAGKTTFVEHLIAASPQLYDKPPAPVFYFYNQLPPTHAGLQALVSEFIQGMPDMTFLSNMYNLHGPNCTIVIDDQALNITKEICELFSVGSSRYLANLIFLTQNLFGQVKGSRDISLNSTYIVIFKNPRDAASVAHLFRQFSPSSWRTYIDIFNDATKEPYSHLLIDCHQATNNNNRLYSNIFGQNKQFPCLYQIQEKEVAI